MAWQKGEMLPALLVCPRESGTPLRGKIGSGGKHFFLVSGRYDGKEYTCNIYSRYNPKSPSDGGSQRLFKSFGRWYGTYMIIGMLCYTEMRKV